MTNQFSILDVVATLRSFKQTSVEPGDFLNYRICREAGDPLLTFVLEKGNESDDPGLSAELLVFKNANLDSEEGEDYNGGLLLVGAITDGFELEDLADDEVEVLGNVQAEDLFIDVLNKGLSLLENSPYFEIQLAFLNNGDGFVCSANLCRTSFDVTNTQQVNTVLFQAVYPLCSVEQKQEAVQGEQE